MKIYKANIGGYDVQVDVWMEDHKLCSEGWVFRGAFSASIACLLDMGFLTNNSNDAEHPVPRDVIREIEVWATDVGY